MNCKILIGNTIPLYFYLIDPQKCEKGKELPFHNRHRTDRACWPSGCADKLVYERVRISSTSIR